MKTKNKKLRPLKKLRKDAWKLFSKFRRKETADENGLVRCVTCGTIKHYKNLFAGHFLHGCLDYNHQNIHPQCFRCNNPMSGNLSSYARFLINKYGNGIIEELHLAKSEEERNPLTRDQIEALIKFYKEKAC